jgi:hypothetical protein
MKRKGKEAEKVAELKRRLAVSPVYKLLNNSEDDI